jgi:hypothetical protein
VAISVKSPKAELKILLANFFWQRDENSANYCFFVPCHGLGDMLAYVAAIPQVRRQGLKLCVLAKTGDPFLKIYQKIFDVVLFADGIELSPWLHGDGNIGPANIFFMWHLGFGGGIDLEVVFGGMLGGHKLAVKASMGLDLAGALYRPCEGFFDGIEEAHRDYVFLSPIANTSASIGEVLLEQIISFVLGRGLLVVLNVADKNRVRVVGVERGGVEYFEGDLWAAARVAKKAKLCINARSGFSEVLSMFGIPFVDIYPSDQKSPFWSLKENFFDPPILEINAADFMPESLIEYL